LLLKLFFFFKIIFYFIIIVSIISSFLSIYKKGFNYYYKYNYNCLNENVTECDILSLIIVLIKETLNNKKFIFIFFILFNIFQLLIPLFILLFLYYLLNLSLNLVFKKNLTVEMSLFFKIFKLSNEALIFSNLFKLFKIIFLNLI
jgi:hypothetical protein